MIKKLQAGDNSIPASGWNEMRAFIQDYSFPQDTLKSPPRNPAYISVKNVTGAALPALSVVKISTPIYTRTGDTFKNKGVEYGVEMNGAAPSSDSDNIAVIQEAIRPGCIGRAICSGATPCIVNKAENKTYKYAKPVTSQTGYMEGTDDVTNYRVLWIASGTGNKEAYILMSHVNRQFITDAEVYQSGTTSLSTIATDINGVTYPVLFPSSSDGLSAPNYPDIYPNDNILVCVDYEAGYCYATDYENGTLMAFYSGQGSPGRGWDAITTPQAMTDAGFTLYQKVKTNAIL